MHPGHHAATKGDTPAVVMAGSGAVVTYAELDERSMRLAQLLYAEGLRPGDRLAILLENHPRYFEVFWAAVRSGLYCTPINSHLTADEAGYIIEDSGAAAVVTSVALQDTIRGLTPHLDAVRVRLVIDGTVEGWTGYEHAIAEHPAAPLDDEPEGTFMFYSSGTTGRPKGIMPPLSGAKYGDALLPQVRMMEMLFGLTPDTVYLCPAPLYHGAPLGWSTGVQRVGGTVVVMESFDAAGALAAIERHRVTQAQFVPTHFVRMLKLADEERTSYDLSSLTTAVHAAAPCPVGVKQKMLDWWGPIIHEYYAGSENNGFCYVGPEEWLAHPGTVGRTMVGAVHILDEDGVELSPGHDGQVWFDAGAVFEYHNDAEKTKGAFNDRGWSSLGDIGHLDDEGFLYLTDRASHMIISGGVNIYPQEAENLLTDHPAVADVAVIGVPNEDFGEEVKAVVVASDPATAGPELGAALIGYCRERLSHFKCPVTVDFTDELPRLPTGKLLKRELRRRYWPT